MKAFATILVFILISQHPGQTKPIEGAWIDEADYLSSITFDKNVVYEMSGMDTIYSGKYFTGFHSCDSNYLKDNNNKYLKFLSFDDGRCFEITGLSDSVLAFLHTTSGRLHVFHKKFQQN